MNGIQYRLRNLCRKFRSDDETEYIYIFNHIPKAGGTAARFVLAEWHTVIADYRRGASETETRRFVHNRLELSTIRRPAVVSGHYGLPGARLHERYPEVFDNPRYRLITFVRDPLETAVSMFFYVKKLGRQGFSDDLEHYLRHYRTDYAGVLNCRDGQCDEALERYWFVGVTEQFTQSFEALSRKMKQPYVVPPKLNTTLRSAKPSAGSVAVFKKNNALDYDIYAAALRSLQDQGA